MQSIESKTMGDPPCVLCSAKDPVLLDELSGWDIQTLWRCNGHNLDENALSPMHSKAPVRLYECRQCGLRYYDPRFAGSAEFYEALMQSAEYAPGRSEFEFTLKIAARNGINRVLDVGAGEGSFLDAARRAGLKTHAIELNRNAARKLAQKGHVVIPRALNDVTPADLGGAVELLTLFQVVEHVVSPASFVSDAVRLVSAGGYLVISVPNEYRVMGLQPYDPANWPPHHVSRWRRNNLEHLARITGLKLVSIHGETLFGRVITQFWHAHNDQARAIGRRPHVGGQWLPEVAGRAYRWLGCKYWFPRWGLSLCAVLQKPRTSE